ncbi:hypothetical protein ABZ569_10745 [Streptomyces albus]|uniref:hypothetical protein n=1 Tax=Streptomyces albus TaxID=1888 RepID=UPI00340B39F1
MSPHFALPEQLLALGCDYTRHQDALHTSPLHMPDPAGALDGHIASTQGLVHKAHTAHEALLALRIYRSPGLRAALARIKQLAALAVMAADYLIEAQDALATAGITAEPEASTARPWALQEASRRVLLAKDLTILGAEDCLAAAELVAYELRQQHITPDHQPLPCPQPNTLPCGRWPRDTSPSTG